MRSEPTDAELLGFADCVLGDLGASVLDDDLLQETITHNQDLWQTLFRVSRLYV